MLSNNTYFSQDVKDHKEIHFSLNRQNSFFFEAQPEQQNKEISAIAKKLFNILIDLDMIHSQIRINHQVTKSLGIMKIVFHVTV